MLKLTDNPPILTPDVESLTDLDGTWWVAYTKTHFEKSFAWDLYSRGIGYFLPMCEYVIFSSGRNRRGMKLLFPSYVFFCGSNEDRHTALTTNRLLQVIDVADQLGLITQLMTIEKGLSCEAGFDPYPYRPVGTRTRIISGPMMGTEGVVIERKNEKARMVLEVTTLGQGTVMEIDADLLEPIHSPGAHPLKPTPTYS